MSLCRVGKEPQQGGIGEIGSMLPDSGNDIVRNPTLEPLRRRELAGEDEGIQTALVDERHLLSARRCFHFGNTSRQRRYIA